VVDSVEGPTAATRRSAVPAHRPTGMSDAQAGATLIESLNRLSELPGPGPTLQRKLPAFRRLARDLGGDPGGAPVAPSRLLRLLARAGWDEQAERLKPGGPLRKNEKEIFAAVEAASRDLAGQAARWIERDLAATVVRLLSAMWRHADREKSRRRALDFSDLEIKTLHLLETHPEVVRSYQARFKHILVDEYQDVNPVQARIVRVLAGDRPNSLFAVGDPKQSIYRFRGADIAQFQGLWQEMEQRGAAFQLKSNYRSHRRLVEAVNAFFDRRIFKGRPPVEMHPARTEPAPAAGASPVERPRIQWLVFDFGDAGAAGRRELEAKILAARIRRMVEDRLAYGDVALLFRATSSLYLYEEAMREARIPYELVKSGTAFRSQEALDLLNALTVLIDPSDTVGWLGFLRSPMAGLSDDAILSLAETGDVRNYFLGRSELPELSDRDREAAARTLRLVDQGRKIERKIRTPLALLDWIVAETGYLAILKGLPQSDARRRNLETLRSAAAQYAEHRPDPHVAFLEAAWRMVERNERESGMDVPARDAVKLMTIHQAKGLEFPVVILPDLLRSESVRTPDFCVVPDSARLTLAARVKLAGLAEKFPTPRWRAAKEELVLSESEEQKRLLYVAMTRAQDLLVLPGPATPAPGGRTVWEMLYEFLAEEGEHVERVTASLPGGPAAREEDTPLLDRLSRVELRPAPPPALIRVRTVRQATAIKEIVEGAAAPPSISRTPDPYAVALGILAHEALEDADFFLDADRQTRRLDEYLRDRQPWLFLPAKRMDQLQKNIARFFQSPLMERLRTERPTLYKEYPFTFRLRGAATRRSAVPAHRPTGMSDAQAGAEQEVWIRGKIDLLILGKAGPEIYDYKYTDPTPTFGPYEGQLLAYALAACDAFDAPAVTVGLQFLSGAQPILAKEISREEAGRGIESLLRVTPPRPARSETS